MHIFLYLIQHNFTFVIDPLIPFNFYHYPHNRFEVIFCLKCELDYNEIGSNICFEDGMEMNNIYHLQCLMQTGIHQT